MLMGGEHLLLIIGVELRARVDCRGGHAAGRLVARSDDCLLRFAMHRGLLSSCRRRRHLAQLVDGDGRKYFLQWLGALDARAAF